MTVTRGMTLLDDLKNQYAWTPYPALGSLIAARVQVEANELDKAAAGLRFVMDNANDDEIKLIGRLRLARVLSAQKKHDEALALLKVDKAGEFAPLVADARGDVLLAKGDREGALREYLAARAVPSQGRVDIDTSRSQDPRSRRHATGLRPRRRRGHSDWGILMNYRSLALVAAAFLALAACSSKNKKVDEPVKLADIKSPTVRIQKVWGASVGGGGKKLRLGLGLATLGNRLFAAGRDGDVAAFDLKTGKQLWRVETKLELAGGTGAGSGSVAVGSADGQVILFSADNGAQKWRADVKGEVLSAPAIADNQVIVRTVDGKLRALALSDGAEIWSAEQQIPRLTLRGTAAPVVAHDMALSGFDNGRVHGGEPCRWRHGLGFPGVAVAWPHRTRTSQRHRCRGEGRGR